MSENPQFICELCDEPLRDIRFKDGTTWTPELLAAYSRRKHGRVFCLEHYREANEARLSDLGRETKS